MPNIQLRRPVAAADVEAFRDLAAAAQRHAGHPVVSDTVWRDLEEPSPDTTVIVARDDRGAIVGAMHATRAESSTSPHTTLSFAVAPSQSPDDVVPALVAAALDDLRQRGGDPVELWVFGADASWDERARRLAFIPERELWQMRVRLPVTETPAWPSGVTTRPFEVGRDDDAWLTVNDRAFADDPDQGGWTGETLRRREHEAWFDPRGFLLAVDDPGLAGFCWTKRHPPAPPVEPVAVGEIYVIGVDPDRQGQGLGRALVLAGLADLHDRQGTPVGMLFVDAANQAGVALYQSIGFTVTRTDRAYRCQL